MKQKTWFVTGASKGFGRILVDKLLEKGERVAATSRSINSFKDIKNDNFLGLEIKDLTNEKDIINALNKTNEKFGSVDVLVNNAGYGQFGAFEEVSDKQMRDLFDVNVFGTFNTIRNVLPIMRKQKCGRIINISSIAGFVGNPYWGAYNASKFAVDGMIDALSGEVKQFNIKVTSVMPGPFRTDFLDPSSLNRALTGNEAYAKEVNEINDFWYKNNRKQSGDPYKAMDAIIEIVDKDLEVEHILFGQWGYTAAQERVDKWQREINEFEYLGKDLDYDE